MLRARGAGLAFLLAAAGCDPLPAPTSATAAAPGPVLAASTTAPAESPTAAGTGGPSLLTSGAPPARPPAPPVTAVLEGAVAVEPAGRLPLAGGVEVTVHPSSTFELELSIRAADARLMLVDARDDLVPSTSTREVGARTRITLAPAEPLVPGSRYALRLDGAGDGELHDDRGRAFAGVNLPLLAAGTPPPPEPKRPAKPRKRR